MAKYHINDKGEAGVCRAKTKCRFGGSSGVDNHFESREAAEKHVQEKLNKQYGQVESLSRGTARDDLKKLANKGVKVEKIAKISQHDFSSAAPDVSTIDLVDEKPTADELRNFRSSFSLHSANH